jgi:diguanylate cyclase (GGDEF)-like protein
MRKVHFGLAVLAGCVIIILLLCAFRIPLDVRRNAYQVQSDYLTGWAEGELTDQTLYHSFGKDNRSRTFTRMIDGKDVNGRSLCLISHNINFTVWLDDVQIYDFRPKLGGFYGTRYGEAVHTVFLPTFTELRELRIEAVSLRDDGSSGCNEAWLCDSHTFMRHIEEESALRLCFCVLSFFFGVMLFVIGIIEDRMRGEQIEAICLGAITLIVSAWIGSQTMTMRVLCDNPGLLRVMEYFALDVLPIPMLLFSAAFTRNLKHPLVTAGVILSALNTVVSVILVLLGKIDYSNDLIFTHALIVSGMVLVIYFIVRSIRNKEMSRRKSTYLISAASILGVSGMLDMVRFYMNKGAGGNFSLLTEIGLFTFAIVLAVYEYRRVIEMQVRSSQAELMQTLAMEDALTKLGSRAAFVAYEKQLKERTSGMCLFVHFDVNNLKRVNDVYGHAEGDRHLIAAANVLRESFGESGKLFRVGGDEFFAILDGATCRADYVTGIKILRKAEEAYNLKEDPPVLLAIAHGMAEYDYTEQNPENAERLADSRMYEEKRRMKAQLA